MQRGQIFKRGTVWQVRYYDGTGKRRQRGNFRTRDEAYAWLEEEILRFDRLGGLAKRLYRPRLTLSELVAEYLEQHPVEANTKRTLAIRLKYATQAFGGVRVDHLSVRELIAWRSTLPVRSAHHIVSALRQVLNYAVAIEVIGENMAQRVPNPRAPRKPLHAFGSWQELELLSAELDPLYRAIPVFAAGTGLRPEEWIALERGDVDRRERVVHVRRVYVDGRIKEYGKTQRSRRRVPLPQRALEALSPPSFSQRLLFPSPRGCHLSLSNWRHDHWHPALEAVGLEKRGPYTLRHTYATFAIAADVSLFHLARVMGTSVRMIDEHYGHLLPDFEEHVRVKLDAWQPAIEEGAEAV